MSYRVFARKYRPQTFEEVIGQEHITRTLQNAIQQDRLAQAYLLVGPRGIGKTSTARILAKALNCEKGPTPKPCCQCNACLEIAEGNNLDVIEIDGASNNGVENIRDLRENAQYTPAKGPFKIYLIDEVHMLSIGAFNALLKTLEEPPAHVKFIFATTEAQKVPPTITSRCQRFDLRRIPDPLIAAHLGMIAEKEGIQLESAAAEAIARGADGGLRDAESMLDQVVSFCGDAIGAADVLDVFGFTPREVIYSIADNILHCQITEALESVSQQDEAGKDLSRLIENLVSHWRDLLVQQADGTSESELAAQASLVSREKLIDLLEHFAACEGRLRWATDKRMQVDVAIIKAVHLLEQASLSEVIETIASLRDGAPPPARPTTPMAKTAPPPKAKPTPPPQTKTPLPVPEAVQEKRKSEPEPKPQESPPTPPKEEPSAQPTPSDPSGIWQKVIGNLIAGSPFTYGWLDTGKVQMENAGRLVVEFPDSQRECAESPIWAEPQRILDAELSEAFGHPVKMHPEFLPGLTVPEAASSQEETEQQEDEAPPDQSEENIQAAETETEEERMEKFKNDPLIRKALDILQAEIVSSSSK